MTPSGIPNRVARNLLAVARRMAPPHSVEWGDAMLAELDVVEGSWEGLRWSVGAAGVLMKDMVLDLLTVRRRETGSPLPPWFVKGGRMRKVTIGVCAFSILIFLGLMLAPTFRQALGVSAWGWRAIFDQPVISPAGMERLAEQARRDRDPESMAFVAMHLPPGEESRHLADEAVKLNPNLTWVYLVLAQRMEPGPASDDLVARVQKWDPGNAVPHLAAADALRGLPKQVDLVLDPKADLPEPWLQKMATAFAATKYDTYVARRLDLERSVMVRRKLDDPMLVVDALPSVSMPNILLLRGYAGHVLATSQHEEAAGDTDRAWQSCWTIAKFGHLISLQAHSNFERLVGASLQLDAFERLRVLTEKKHNPEAGALIAAQSEELRLLQRSITAGGNSNWMPAYRNASVSQAASLGALVSLGLLLAAGLIWLLRRLRPAAAAPRPSRILALGAVAGAAGLAASSLTIYLSYKPFADVFSRFLQSKGMNGAEALYAFYGFADVDIPYLNRLIWDVHSSFWYLLLTAAGVLMLVELSRIIRGSPKPSMAK
jgi:hypothetical protein